MALTDNLLSYWKFDETSGTRGDSVGSNTLQTLNTPGSAAGKISNAVSLTRASSQGLQITHANQAPDLSVGSGDFTINTWLYLDSKPAGQMGAVVKYDFVAGQREYWVHWDNTADRFQFQVFNNAAASTIVVANNFGAPSTGTWYMVTAYIDQGGNIAIIVNDGTPNTVALGVTTHNGTAPFNIGYTGNSGSPFTFWDGRIDETGIWNRQLTSAEITQLYNAGAGLTYPFSAPIEPRRRMMEPDVKSIALSTSRVVTPIAKLFDK